MNSIRPLFWHNVRLIRSLDDADKYYYSLRILCLMSDLIDIINIISLLLNVLIFYQCKFRQHILFVLVYISFSIQHFRFISFLAFCKSIVIVV